MELDSLDEEVDIEGSPGAGRAHSTRTTIGSGRKSLSTSGDMMTIGHEPVVNGTETSAVRQVIGHLRLQRQEATVDELLHRRQAAQRAVDRRHHKQQTRPIRRHPGKVAGPAIQRRRLNIAKVNNSFSKEAMKLTKNGCIFQ